MEKSTADLAKRKRLFVLCHTYTLNIGDPDREDSDTKELYYSFSNEKCEEQIGFYKNLEGFKDYPHGFRVMEIRLEMNYWESGFSKW